LVAPGRPCPPRRRRRATLASGLVIAASILATGYRPTASGSPNPSTIADHAPSMCPQSGEAPPKDVTDEAVRILRERLTLLGVADPEITVASCIEVAFSRTGQEAEAVQAAVLGTGRVELVPVPADQAEAVHIGGPPPEAVPPLVGPQDLAGAATSPGSGGAGPTLVLTLTDAGTGAVASWTRVHVGEAIALVVDGVVVAMPITNEPILGGSVSLSVGGQSEGQRTIPIEAVRAMVESGPLPIEWAQPERPQG
jgi:preprotein translocase subunit SecD